MLDIIYSILERPADLVANQEMTQDYFSFLISLIERDSPIDLARLTNLLLTNFPHFDVFDSGVSSRNTLLSGVLTVMLRLAERHYDSLCLMANHPLFLQTHLLQHCLLQLPQSTDNRGQQVYPKCKTQSNRKTAFSLLHLIMTTSCDRLESMSVFMKKVLVGTQWRSASVADWSLSVPLPSPTQQVGILNLGNTCYMNSMMQILFSVSEFRDSILSLSLSCQPDSVLSQFQLLLTSLLRSHRPFYDPSPFCQSLNVNVNR